jgi:hypothetical protein
MLACIFCGGLEFLFGGIVLCLIWVCHKVRRWLGHPVEHTHTCPSCLCGKYNKTLMICGSIIFMIAVHAIVFLLLCGHDH